MKTFASGSSRLPLLLILAASLAAGLGLWLGARWSSDPAGGNPQVLQNALLFPAPRELPAFHLDGPGAVEIDADALRGRWSLVFVGFTHCPDICPTTLATLGELRTAVPDLQPALQVLFVSVDPERDSADRAGEYAHYFVPDALAATADHPRLTAFTRSLGMVYMQSPLADGDYTVDHSASIAILDPQARQVGMFRPPFDVARMAADMRQLAGAR
jgi:protein SCO1/2